jgi:ribosome-binding factor A
MKTESIRQRKIADQIKKALSLIIDRKLKDPRKGFITLTQVKVTGDLRIANIYYTSLGGEKEHKSSQEALESANKYLRNELAPVLGLRYTPELRFFYDESLEYSQHINKLIQQIHEKDQNKES